MNLFDPMNPLSLIVLSGIFAILPLALICATTFLKMSVVLGIVRNGFGVQGVPSNFVIGTLALVLTIISMNPVGQQIASRIAPLLQENPRLLNKSEQIAKQLPKVPAEKKSGERAVTRSVQAELHEVKAFYEAVSGPLLLFLNERVGKEERQSFLLRNSGASPAFPILLAAFALSELREAFRIGLLLYLPFVVIDLLVANILVGLGMMMVNPVSISFPLKLLLFVVCDGWSGICNVLLAVSSTQVAA